METGLEITYLKGQRPTEFAQEALRSTRESFVARNPQYDAEHLEQLCEAFVKKNPRFSVAKMIDSVCKESGGHQSLREAITSDQSAAAINMIVVHSIYNDYAQYQAIWRDLAEVETSTGDSELYPEEWSDDMPVPLAETEPAPETRASALSIRIKNYEWGRALAISKKAFRDDKTGQVRRLSENFGNKFPKVQDKAFMTAFFRAGTIANLISNGGTIPATNIAGQSSFGAYAPTAGPINPQRLEDALVAPAYFVDPYNVEIDVDFDTVLVDSFDRLKAKRFLNSVYTSNITPTTDATGQLAGPFSENILKGEFKIASHTSVKRARAPLSGLGFPWAVLKAGRGAVMQIRQDFEVTMEDPNAGDSFKQRSMIWQGNAEFGTGVRNARVILYGN